MSDVPACLTSPTCLKRSPSILILTSCHHSEDYQGPDFPYNLPTQNECLITKLETDLGEKDKDLPLSTARPVKGSVNLRQLPGQNQADLSLLYLS
jgi:hypothetical protein